MSTAVAVSVPAAPIAPRSADPTLSPRTRPLVVPSPRPSRSSPVTDSPPAGAFGATVDNTPAKSATDEKTSPSISRSNNAPKIVVKKENPSSPELPTARHRPRRLDLSLGSSTSQAPTSARQSTGPLTSRETAGMAMQDVGLACLSPGFSTQDPAMREQLQRSISVRDQQRSIIESRLQKTAKSSDGGEGLRLGDQANASLKTPSTSRRRAPPGLSIVPPSHEQFANERVIQSAPLNQTFTGRHQPHPLTRHVGHPSSHLSNTSHIHHLPATQTNNRLPPLSDVFGASEGLVAHRDGPPRPSLPHTQSGSVSSHSIHRSGFPSPGLLPGGNQPQPPERPREYRSAEEAVALLSGGREDLLPRIVHYGGHQPPTPPSPLLGNNATGNKIGPSNGEFLHTGARRRTRAEYEGDNGSPPLGGGPDARRGPFGEGRSSPETQRRKKEEFLSLCSQAWDLFHS